MRFFAFFQWNKKKGIPNGLTGGFQAGILRKKEACYGNRTEVFDQGSAFFSGGFSRAENIPVLYQHVPPIRLRQWDDRYILTVKGKGLLAKEEFELEITKEEYDHLLTKAESPAVEKVRYLVPLEDGLTAEVDVYEGKLAGLMTTEVEFPTLEEAETYEPPYWFGKDVSFDHRYKNTSLSLYGIPEEQE